MKKTLLVLLMLGMSEAWSDDIYAKKLNAGYPICPSEHLLSEMLHALKAQDKEQLLFVIDRGCLMTRSDLKFTVLDAALSGVTHLRVYLKKNKSIEAWTMIGAVLPEDVKK